MTLTSDTAWTLSKTGSVNTTAKTVTWNVTATKGTTTTGQLVVNGTFRVSNTGTGGATIGNIVVNLQTKSGSTWVTRSSVVADATQDDAATTVKISPSASSEGKSTFTENAASGQLIFMDAKTNSIFSLVPQVTIPAGATRTLLFTASYDNNVLMLAPGTATRVEIIVSFGNAASNTASTPNVDINGNGIIDADEAYVRSVPARGGLVVPQSVPGNATVTLSDKIDDITTTGTVTFSNAQFNLGATSGTVSVSYNPGANGGTITNCAHLTSASSSVNSGGHNFPSVIGIDLTACDTQTIGAHTCTPGTQGCGWEEGDLVTFTSTAWGTPSSAAENLLLNNFFTVYAAQGFVEIGVQSTVLFSARFTGPTSIVTYLPATGTPAPLNADLVDPSSTASGSFGGEVLALTLNIDFAGLTGGSSGISFGNLTVCGVMPTSLNGTSVSGLLGIANVLLGGGTNGYTITEVLAIIAELNNAFTGGAPSTWAQTHLFNGPCP